MKRSVGTCGNCGGAVTVPNIWHGVQPPIPTCSSCGATPREPHGPVIDMAPRKTEQARHPHHLPFDRWAL